MIRIGNFGGYVSNAKEFVKKKDSVSVYTLRDSIIDRLSVYLKTKTQKHTQMWAESDQNQSIRQLLDTLRSDLESKEIRRDIDAIVKDEIDKWKNIYTEVIREAVIAQLAKEYPEDIVKGLIPTKAIWRQLFEKVILQSGAFSFDNLVESISVYRLITASINYLLYLQYKSFLRFFPPGFIPPYIDPEKMLEIDYDEPRAKSTRRGIRNQLDEMFMLEDYKKNIFKSIYNIFNECNKNFDQELSNHLEKMFRIVMLYPDGFKDRIIK